MTLQDDVFAKAMKDMLDTPMKPMQNPTLHRVADLMYDNTCVKRMNMCTAEQLYESSADSIRMVVPPVPPPPGQAGAGAAGGAPGGMPGQPGMGQPGAQMGGAPMGGAPMGGAPMGGAPMGGDGGINAPPVNDQFQKGAHTEL
jgi:hypothetical protein